MRNILLLIVFVGLVPLGEVFATTHSVDIVAHVPGCGDGLIQGGEQCDGTNLGGSTCASLGFTSGSLSCSSACTFVTSSCSLVPISQSSGGTRTRAPIAASPNTNLVVFGQAAPFSTVTLLKDGQRVASAPVGQDGTFQMTVAGVGSGVHYIFLSAERLGYQTGTSQMIAVQVVKEATTKVGPIILPPLVMYRQVGQDLTVSGYAPVGQSVAVQKNGLTVSSLTTDVEGFFKTIFGVETGDSISLSVIIGGEPVASTKPFVIAGAAEEAGVPVKACALKGDINADCNVGPVDFFITRFRLFEQLLSSRFDFNGDGQTDIVDFSIMAFYWTG